MNETPEVWKARGIYYGGIGLVLIGIGLVILGVSSLIQIPWLQREITKMASTQPARAPAPQYTVSVEREDWPQSTNEVTTFREHVVEQGEDLYTISLLWNVSVESLQRMNGLSGAKVQAGQVVKVPWDPAREK